MSQPYPLTPPLGWVLDLLSEARKRAKSYGCGQVDYVYMVNKSAQMGWDQRGEANEAELQRAADQELEACLEHLSRRGFSDADILGLHAARRPKPPSLKDQAMEAAQRFYAKGHEGCTDEEVKDDFDAICRALEQLND